MYLGRDSICFMLRTYSWAFRHNFITIYYAIVTVVVCSCIPIDLASISGGTLLTKQGIPLSK